MLGRKKIIRYFIFISLFVYCSCDQINIDVIELGSSQDSLFFLNKRYNIEHDNMFYDLPTQLTTNDNIIFYFSHFFARAIYKTYRPFNKFIKIGSSGNGPREYSSPREINIFDNKIYYSDINNVSIKHILLDSLTNERSGEINDYSGTIGGRSFLLNGSYLYAMSPMSSPYLDIYNIETGKIDTSLIKLDKMYEFPITRKMGGGVRADNFGNIYVMFSAPFSLFKISKEKGSFTLTQYDFEKLTNLESWTLDKYESIIPNDGASFINAINSFNSVLSFEIIGNDKQYLFVCLASDSGYIYYLISLKGKIIKKYFSNNQKLIAAHFNTLFFHSKKGTTICNDCNTILEYNFKNTGIKNSNN